MFSPARLYEEAVSRLNPVAHWSLREKLRTDTITDRVGTNHGAWIGSVNVTNLFNQGCLLPSGIGSSIRPKFSGYEGLIHIGAVLNFEYNVPFSISAIIKIDNITSDAVIISKIHSSGSPYRGYELRVWDGTILFNHLSDTSNGISYRSPSFLQAGQIYHITCTYDGSTNQSGLRIYSNAVIMTGGTYLNTATVTATTVGTAPLCIGARYGAAAPTLYCPHHISEVSIFNYALTQQNISSLYQGTKRFFSLNRYHRFIKDLNPSIYYGMEGNSGTTIYDEMGTLNGLAIGTGVSYSQPPLVYNSTASTRIVSVDGVSESRIRPLTSLITTYSTFYVGGWIDGDGILFDHSNTNTVYMAIWGDGDIRFIHNTNGGGHTIIVVPQTEQGKKHLLLNYDGTTLSFYLNGSHYASVNIQALGGWNISGSVVNDNTIGAYSTNGDMYSSDATVGEIVFGLNKTISAQQVQSLYALAIDENQAYDIIPDGTLFNTLQISSGFTGTRLLDGIYNSFMPLHVRNLVEFLVRDSRYVGRAFNGKPPLGYSDLRYAGMILVDTSTETVDRNTGLPVIASKSAVRSTNINTLGRGFKNGALDREYFIGPDSISGYIYNNSVSAVGRVMLFDQSNMHLIAEQTGTHYNFSGIDKSLTYMLIAYHMTDPENIRPVIQYNINIGQILLSQYLNEMSLLSPLVHYKFNSSADGVISNSASPGVYDLIATNITIDQDGSTLDSSGLFDGTSSKGSLDIDTMLSNQATFGCWVNIPAMDSVEKSLIYQPITTEDGKGRGILISTGNNVSFISRDTSSVPYQISKPGIANVEQMLVFTQNGTSLSGYINGFSIGKTTMPTAYSAWDNSIHIGAKHNAINGLFDTYSNIVVDDAFLFNKTLTQSQILDLYYTGKYKSYGSVNYDSIIRNLALKVNRWSIDGDTGVSIVDRVGAINGTSSAGVSFTGGLHSGSAQALSFNGTTGYVDIAGKSLSGATKFTISLWAKFSTFPSGASQYLISIRDGVRILGQGGTGSILLQVFNGTGWITIQSIETIYANKIYHIVASYDGEYLYLYINGVINSQLAHTAAIVEQTVYARLGANSSATPAEFLGGAIDDVIILDRSIYLGEVVEIYNYGAFEKIMSPVYFNDETVMDMNPLAYWKFDEAFGGIAYDITTSANNLTSITGITKEYKVNGFKGAVSGFHYDGGSTGHVTGAVNNVPLRILGDVSISVLIKKTGALPGTDSHIVACAHSGETEAANFVYSLRCVAATNELGVFHEYSTGANVSTVVTPILDNVEYYITLTRNSALKEYRIYINGILSSVLTYTSAPTGGSTSVLSIGNHASVTAAWRGLISNVSIFNRTISGAEAVSMYHAIKHGALDEIRYDEIITSSGLIGRWKMTGDAVLVEPNTTGIANGIPVGQISNGLGLFDASSSSKHFDGSTGYLNISGHTLASTTNVSISCWIRVAAINTLRNYIYYAEGGVFLYIENGKLVFGIYNGSTYPSVSSVLDVQIGRAYYLVGTYNATNVRLYIDTVLQGQSASTTAIANVTAYPGSFIGRGNGAAGTHSYFNGNVDDLLAINYALTQKDIDLIYKSSAISGDMTTYLGVLLPMRPVFHLPLNGSANEIISNTATTVVGGVTADIGITNRLNRSLLFNGTTGYINFDAATARVSQFSEITVVAWFNTTAAPANTFGNIIFSINGTGVSNLLRFGIGTSGEIFNSTGAITSQVTGTGYNNGVTHMLAITARSSGANTTMYVDNILMSSTGSPFNFSETLYVSIGQEYDGGPVPTDFYSGKLSTLSIFDRSLTAEEVSLLYNTGRLQS